MNHSNYNNYIPKTLHKYHTNVSVILSLINIYAHKKYQDFTFIKNRIIISVLLISVIHTGYS